MNTIGEVIDLRKIRDVAKAVSFQTEKFNSAESQEEYQENLRVLQVLCIQSLETICVETDTWRDESEILDMFLTEEFSKYASLRSEAVESLFGETTVKNHFRNLVEILYINPKTYPKMASDAPRYYSAITLVKITADLIIEKLSQED